MIDRDHKIQARGAYICKNEECFSKVIKQRILNRSFKQNVSEKFYESLAYEMRNMNGNGTEDL